MNMTFQPQLNLNSRQIDNHNNAGYTEGAGHSRRDLLFQRADEYEYRRARLQEQFMKKEMEECTVLPAANCTHHESYTLGDALFL